MKMEAKKHTDSLIENGVDKISHLLDELDEKIDKNQNYRILTNCRWDNKNIRTLTIAELIQIYRAVVLEELSWNITKQELGLDNKFNVKDFSVEAWKSDLKHFIEIKTLNSRKDELLNKKNSLTNLYSDEKKTLSSIEALLSDI